MRWKPFGRWSAVTASFLCFTNVRACRIEWIRVSPPKVTAMQEYPQTPIWHRELACCRRDFLARAGSGFGLLALSALLEGDVRGASSEFPPATRQPHYTPKAKSVIWCFLDGGPSHIDLFDPKPELQRLGGQPLPGSFKRPVTSMGKTAYTPLLGTKRNFKQYGKCGAWVSDWYPEIAGCADDLAIIRSCYAD